MLLAIDPGPKLSAWVLYNGDLFNHGTDKNEELLRRILWDRDLAQLAEAFGSWMVIENITPRIRSIKAKDGTIALAGQPAETHTLETMFWIGRFWQAFGSEKCTRLNRLSVKKHICGTASAKDGDIRRALIQRWFERTGNPKPERKGGDLYKVTGHVWQALALAMCWWETEREFVVDKKTI